MLIYNKTLLASNQSYKVLRLRPVPLPAHISPTRSGGYLASLMGLGSPRNRTWGGVGLIIKDPDPILSVLPVEV